MILLINKIFLLSSNLVFLFILHLLLTSNQSYSCVNLEIIGGFKSTTYLLFRGSNKYYIIVNYLKKYNLAFCFFSALSLVSLFKVKYLLSPVFKAY